MTDEPLYEDKNIKIDYHPTSGEDHFIEFGSFRYTLARGVLEDFARVPREHLVGRIETYNSMILGGLGRSDVGIDGLYDALCQAYAEEGRRIRAYVP
ncbi:hypothetical protein HOD05_02970 [Candidatus Woesearchaeota archaeon]|jgi:hypothetical protein|nr:hypothetical protein [Candidatus Woesearchaeota archaeon]MBT4151335.1 hypothetical protein [Candidatus Woesearchaeota archaeon]MBT4247428.1 hypothetical protein [Candidatus Woesearchaeota archaeon]MBT4434157.1 hypothetical protein [Candidatus Woesearchaeota archaeon]MBT7332474.1 hypothetical protein [Candidatus Woesearchaeota archaeon]